MKTKQLFFLGFLGLIALTSNAQVTETTNAVSSASSYVGTSNNNDVLFKRQAVDAGLLSTTKTSFGVNSFASPNSVSIGVGAGQFSTGTGYNTFIGEDTGKGSTPVGNLGSHNTFIGNRAGIYNWTGSRNIAIGNNAGHHNYDGNNNIFIGDSAGNEDGSHGNNNIFIGTMAGFYENSSNTLAIENNGSDVGDPLIWGNFLNDQLKFHAKVGIGAGGNFGNFPTTAGSVNVSNYNLFVKGGILTEEVRVNLQSNWADYVFSTEYKLKTLEEVENYIKENGHLENVPSATQVKEEGIELGEMVKIQQEKIEELTLYLIQQNKEIQELKESLKSLRN